MRFDRDEVLARVDLEELADFLLGARHPRTRTWSCPNPSHAQTGRTPPVTIFAGHRGQRWYCHGCGDGGTAIDLTLRAGPAGDFQEAIHWLADRQNISPAADAVHRSSASSDLPSGERRPDAAARRALQAYAESCAAILLSSDGDEVRAWLTETRAIPIDVLIREGVGVDPGPKRLLRRSGIPRAFPAAVFPVRHHGEVVFTQSRVVGSGAIRWLNAASQVAENPRIAFLGMGVADTGPIVVTEGMIDGLSVVTAGCRAAVLLGVATAGDSAAERLASAGGAVVLATDNDDPGRRARADLSAALAKRGVAVSHLVVPDPFKDINEWHTSCRERWTQLFMASVRLSLAHRGEEPVPPGLG